MLTALAFAISVPIVIAHRGASAERPEHTLEAYRLAIQQGADYVEPDLVITKDGVLICRHENEISGTTDVASRPEFADKKTTKTVDGRAITGWFSEDFTWAELRTLGARERIPQVRPSSKQFDGRYRVPTFEEVLRLVRAHNQRSAKKVGVYPETKHPSYFRSIGLALEEPLVRKFDAFGYEANSLAFIQSFEVENLKRLKQMTSIKLIQLIDASGKPFDVETTYAQMTSDEGLAAIAEYAAGIGPAKNLVIPRVDGRMGEPTDLVERAHGHGLLVHPWTFRPEPIFLPAGMGNDGVEEIREFFAAGVDGVFADSVTAAVRARQER
jgi:glycerophosphoryl diester phosphodiesterase